MANYQLWALIPAAVALLCLIGGVLLSVQMYQNRDLGVWVDVADDEQHDGRKRDRRQQRVHVQQPQSAPTSTPSFYYGSAAAPAKKDAPTLAPCPPSIAAAAAAVAPKLAATAKAAATPWQLAQRAELEEDATAIVPKPIPREPLVIAHKLEYARKLSKFTFQSDQRDIQQYPLESYYRLQLDIPLRNVVGVYMNNAVMPISEPNVNYSTQWIDIDVAGTVYQVAVPKGEYDAINIALAIQNAIQAMGGPLAAFTVSLDPITRKFTINTNGPPCIILWKTGPNVNRSMWMVMGFPRIDTPDAVSHTAPGILDISGTMAIDVFISEIKKSINSVDNSFVRIPMQRFAPTSTITYFTFTTAGLPVTFWPIARLQYLTFSFLVKTTCILPNGEVVTKYRPYDFEGRQHTFQLTIETKEYKNVFEDTLELDPQS